MKPRLLIMISVMHFASVQSAYCEPNHQSNRPASTESASSIETYNGAHNNDNVAKEILQNSCTACHDLNVVTVRHRNRDEWKSTFGKMIGYGANLSQDEKSILEEYLSK